MKLTLKDLKTIKYHLDYDIDTIGENHNWKEIGLNKQQSLRTQKKVNLLIDTLK